jgi:hypothetical protein
MYYVSRFSFTFHEGAQGHMRIKHLLGILLAVSLIFGNASTSPVTAQAPPGSDVRLLSSDGQAIVLELTVDDFQIETLEHAGQTYHRLIIPDTVQTSKPGEPQVPTRSTMLGLSSTEDVSVQLLDADYETLSGYRLHPAPRLELPGDNVDDLLAEGVQQTFALNQELYATDAFYPGTPVEIGLTGHMRDQAVAQVQFYPVQYNPVTDEVRLYRRILAQITWEPLLSAAATGAQGASPAYENLLRNTILNYDALERPPVIDTPPPIEAPDIVALSITALKIGVTEDGLYQLNPSDLTGAGFDLSGVALSTIKMKNRGTEIPIYVHDDDSNNTFNGDDYILFYGTAINDMYTTKNVYWLEAGGDPGQRMGTRDGTPSGGTVPTHFPVTLHAEEDTSYWKFMPSGAGQDHWFWGEKFSAPEWREYNLTLNHISTTASTATVRVRLKGYTTPNHRTKIYLNGHEIDDQTWSGQITYDHDVTVSHSYLDEGSNTLRVEAVDTGLNQFYVNWIEIDYWDTYVAENDELLFGAPQADPFQFEVTGFSSNNVDVFDVTNAANVVVITNTNALTDGRQFEDTAQAETRYLALTPAQRKSPASIEPDQPSSWKSSSNGADYIIITYEDFYTEALRLAGHRSAPDMRVVTAKVGDIYDEFNYGIFNPQAIRDFLAYAYEEWVDPAPTYVLLVGDGTYDYKDNYNAGRVNYVPTQLVEDSFGQTVSDNWFVLVDGADILPDMFIGRLAAWDVSQVENIVDKIIHYDQNPPGDSWNKKALWVADDGNASDGYTDAFETTSDYLADLLPFYYTANKVYVRNYPPGDPTTDITNRINDGSILVNYAGHGGTYTWGKWTGGWIFQSSDVTALSNTHKLPVVTAADCLNGYFVGTTTSMAEEFQRLSDKGAVAVWASTGLGYASGHKVLLGAFYEAIFQDDLYALGAATTAAKIQSSSWSDLIKTFVLFGDPATQLGIPTNYPYVESTTPADGASDVPIDQDIEIVFSKPMNPATVVLSGPGTAGVNFTPTWSANNTVLNYAHTDFGYDETRAFTISGQDNLDNPLGTGSVPSTWSFTTLIPWPTDVVISGPTTGVTETTYIFTADVSPSTAAQPITYVWQATNQSQKTHTGGGLSDTVDFTWHITGTQSITVTATNAYGTATDNHTITIYDPSHGPGAFPVYLPIVIKNQ